ncbi:phosphatase activator [Kwoniella heveanensis CBS 569]|uniref:Phosphatase activator n=1 Tax=Kwoniella heveanensis BCC8398 TaxID=1296120 RepID=A0A1B9GXZ6_9TREE|nr:phosphatase activator [Kwoniella heveanensis BCC8398]OCF45542.1 phosphatase activator [Kwoniella heveanensis CBS 569]
MAVSASSNPITSVPSSSSSSPITSVQPQTYASPLYPQQTNPQLLTRLNLDLRGRMFPVDRETLMLLPESVLLGLFPQGLILSKPASSEGGDDGIFTVDFDPDCFEYILNFWSTAQTTFYGTPTSPGLFHAQQSIPSSPSDPVSDHSQNPLLSKQAIIVLREELEYFSITKAGGLAKTDITTGMPNAELRALKKNCGKALEDKKSIFAALERNVNTVGNAAEAHLIDMLCMSGFNRNDSWGFRACEPSRNVITSMALVLLKTGIVHPEDPKEGPPYIDAQQMGTAQKLLLFWRKPARKCWWDGVEVQVPASTTSKDLINVKVWSRRVWTLELSLTNRSYMPARDID